MRVLVTGGCGYIGSCAVRHLAEAGHQVLILDNLSTGFARLAEGFEFIEGDISDHALVARCLERSDAVMHFAAFTHVGGSVSDPRTYYANNVEAGLALLDAVLASNVRIFVFSSSAAVYGVPESLPITETLPKDPISPYGETKLAFERILSAYSVAYGLKSASLRYFNAAGAHASGTIGEMHNPETHLIPLALQAILGTAPPLKVFGTHFNTPDGTCIRDYIHVSDLASAHIMALEYLAAGGETTALNLGTGHGSSILELIKLIEELTVRKLPHEVVGARAGDPPALFASPEKAHEILGWQAKHDLRSILTSAWLWEQKKTIIS